MGKPSPRLMHVLAAVLEAPVHERSKLLGELCGEDPDLRSEAERIVRDGEGAIDSFDPLGLLPGLLASAEDAVGQGEDRLADPEYRDRSATADLPKIGQYTVGRLIGSGGMGEVYEGLHPSTGRPVAIKVILPGKLSTKAEDRFKFEATTLAKLAHRGIAQIIDYGVDDSVVACRRPYLVMELIKGKSLSQHATRLKLSVSQKLELMREVCAAVHHAHQNGVIHCDLKPGNILVDGSGQPKVVDFGIARALSENVQRATLTGGNEVFGSLPYMSPEQAQGQRHQIDTRTDVYSLGVTVYELLSRRLPHDLHGKPITSALRMICDEQPPRLGQLAKPFRDDLEWIVAKAMEKDKERRYGSAGEFAEDLRRYLAYEPVSARPPGVTYRLGKWVRRHKIPVMSGAVVAVLLGSLAFFLVAWQAVRATRAEGVARRQISDLYVRAGAAQVDIDPSLAMLYFAKALEADADDPTRAAGHRLRLEATRTYAPSLLNVKPGAIDPDEPQGGQTGLDLVRGGVCLRAFVDHGKREYGVQILDAATGHELAGMVRHRSLVNAIAFSPDGRSFLTASRDGTTRIWGTADGKSLGPNPGLLHDGPLECAAWSPDGRGIVTGGWKGGPRVWDVSTGRQRELSGLGAVMRVAYSPDGRRIAAGNYSGLIALWDVLSGNPITQPTQWLEGPVWGLAFSPDGRLVAVGGRDTAVRLINTQTGKAAGPPLRHPTVVESVRFSPDGERVITASRDGLTRTWGVRPVAPPRIERIPGVSGRAIFSPDGQRMLLRTYGKKAGDTALLLWDLRAPSEPDRPATRVVTPSLPAEDIAWCGFSLDGSKVVIVVKDDGLRVQDAQSGRVLASHPIAGSILHVAVDRNVSRVAVVSVPDPKNEPSRSLIQVYDAASVQPLGRPLAGGDAVADAYVEFSPDGRLFVTAGWGWRNRAPADVHKPEWGDGRSVTAAGWGAARLWTAAPITSLETANVMEHGHRVYRAYFSPGGSKVLTCSADETARVWNLRGMALTAPMYHTGPVTEGAFSPDGRVVVTVSEDHTARVWDADTGRAISAPLPHDTGVQFLGFGRGGACFLTAAGPPGGRIVRAWETATGLPMVLPVVQHPEAQWWTFSPDGTQLLSTGNDHVTLWDFRPDSRPVQDLVHLAELLAGQKIEPSGGNTAAAPLSANEWNDRWRDLSRRYPAEFSAPTPPRAAAAD